LKKMLRFVTMEREGVLRCVTYNHDLYFFPTLFFPFLDCPSFRTLLPKNIGILGFFPLSNERREEYRGKKGVGSSFFTLLCLSIRTPFHPLA
jgi:hypothetical protein